MATVTSYKELVVWKKAMELVREIYLLTESFPKDETYGLKSQMERAAVSIPSQIAEGSLRGYTKEYLHFLSISLGSAAELETQILICKSLNKFKTVNFVKSEALLQEVIKMLFTIIKRMKSKQ
jgi:four helix bundle protein